MTDRQDHRRPRLERQAQAFATTAATIARETSLEVVLNRLAAEVRAASGLATCAVVLIDGVDELLSYVGWSGLPPDYVERFEASRHNGAPSITMDAFRSGRTIVARGLRDRVFADARWSPAHDLVRDVDWDAFVAAPLIVRGEPIGALNGFYHLGEDPEPDDVRFVAVMADHAAIAVDNARLLASLRLRAAEEERHRLAREMHDSVSQALFSLSLQARGIELSAATIPSGELAEQLRELRELAQGALSELRGMIQFRRPAELRDEGLVRGLERLADAVRQRSGVRVEVVAPDTLVLEPHLEDDLFRLVQEALNNVVKHAKAASARVLLNAGPEGTLVIEVVDDGIGPGPRVAAGQGFGMSTMRDRAERHGGTVRVEERSDGRGTRVRVRVPRAVHGLAGHEETP